VLRLLLTVVLAPLAAWWLASRVLVAWGLRAVPRRRFDVIVVPGCAVRPDGQPSPALRRRAEAAIALWRDGLGERLLFTGGHSGGPVAEAVAAAALAVHEGVPKAAILVEDASLSTEENAELGALAAAGARSALVVTDAYHAFRAQRVFGRFFDEVVAIGTPTPGWSGTRFALREVVVLLVYAARGWL
jgi:uncharacterized SAM-binding protein YcdF (DUF218 family)